MLQNAFCRLELGRHSARSEFGSFAAGLFDNLGVNLVDFVNQLGVFEMARIFVENPSMSDSMIKRSAPTMSATIAES